jgi:hypothetical protein
MEELSDLRPISGADDQVVMEGCQGGRARSSQNISTAMVLVVSRANSRFATESTCAFLLLTCYSKLRACYFLRREKAKNPHKYSVLCICAPLFRRAHHLALYFALIKTFLRICRRRVSSTRTAAVLAGVRLKKASAKPALLAGEDESVFSRLRAAQ